MDITTDTYAERPLDGPVLFTTMNHNKVTLVGLIVCLMHVSPKMIITCTPQTCTLPKTQRCCVFCSPHTHASYRFHVH